MIEITPASVSDAGLLEAIAQPIWRQHYQPIIGIAQVEYMLARFQSEKAIAEQIVQGYEYFIIRSSQDMAGYMAVEYRKRCLFISKFYLTSAFRGKGIGKIMLEKIHQLALAKDLGQLELTVNKHNPAYHIYLKLGFENKKSIQIDIGNGYIMDDYHMIKHLDNRTYNQNDA